jgi:5'-3' exonuclease
MDYTKPIILVDLSNYVCYRFFALQKWLVIAKKADEYTIEMTRDKFKQLFISNLTTYIKKLKSVWGNVILARDCQRSTIWRMDVYADYKKNRDTRSATSTMDPEIFNMVYNEIVPELCKLHKLHMMNYPTAEGDDVIAIVHDYIRERHANTRILIMSSDSDFLQLYGPNTDIINFQLKSIAAKTDADQLGVYLVWKVLNGDTADNIPPIIKSKAAALKMALDGVALKTFREGSVNKANYVRNNTLINFQYIPEKIRQGVILSIESDHLV